jgi:hypothetical protein
MCIIWVPHNVITNSSIFSDIVPYSPLKVNRRFGGTFRSHLRSWRISQTRNQLYASSWFLLCSLIALKTEVKMFFRNVVWNSTDYKALYPRRYNLLLSKYCLKIKFPCLRKHIASRRSEVLTAVSMHSKYSLLCCEAVWSWRALLTFRWRVLFLASEFKILFPCCQLLNGYPLCLVFNSENGSIIFFWNVGKLLLHYTASHPKTQHLHCVSITKTGLLRIYSIRKSLSILRII